MTPEFYREYLNIRTRKRKVYHSQHFTCLVPVARRKIKRRMIKNCEEGRRESFASFPALELLTRYQLPLAPFCSLPVSKSFFALRKKSCKRLWRRQICYTLDIVPSKYETEKRVENTTRRVYFRRNFKCSDSL